MDFASELFRIFSGNQRGHGEYIITGSKGSKASGKAKTVQEPPTEDLWRKHLAGELGLGIIPITEKSDCTWGAVDIDVYDQLNLEEWSQKITPPLVLCRSKSGGAHIFLFTTVPVPATLMRKKLSLVARAVGHANAEIFPKQDALDAASIGNWINMPFFAGDNTTRYCLRGGLIVSLENFIQHVSECTLTPKQLADFSIDSLFEFEEDSEFADAPPCIRYLVKHGIPVGTRNSALFSMGVFAKKKYPKGWEDKIYDYNKRFMSGTYSEVAGIIRSVEKDKYYYKCKDQPLLSVCDKDTCANTLYGVQLKPVEDKARRPCILDLVDKPVKCYEPDVKSKDDPYWVFMIDGRELIVTMEMADNQNKFAREYLRQFHKKMLPVTPSRWTNKLNELFEEEEKHLLAPDAGPEGQLMVHVEEFCTNKARARAKEELILGKPWKEGNIIYFRSQDLLKYLDQQRFREFKGEEVHQILKGRGSKHHNFKIKGKYVTCWSMPAFEEQTEGFEREAILDDTEF